MAAACITATSSGVKRWILPLLLMSQLRQAQQAAAATLETLRWQHVIAAARI
jgi:hypothetical protein